MIEQVQNLLKQNNFAQGGLFVLLGGSVLGLVWKAISWIRWAISVLFFVEVKAISSSEVFYYLQHWLHNTEYTKKYCSNLLVSKYGNYEIYQPSYGRHTFIHNKRLYILYYSVENNNQMRVETISLSAFCLFGKRKIASNVIDEGRSIVETGEYKGTNIYGVDCGYWEKQGLRKDNFTPILSDGQYEKIIKDIDNFAQNESWYTERGLNYKRGYLFYGPPGNGKTTGILSIAQKNKKDLYIINLADKNLTESCFLRLIASVPRNGYLCIEDIDAAESSAKRQDDTELKLVRGGTSRQRGISAGRLGGQETTKISLSTILNTFDGLYTPQGLVFFMTTNHIEKLDPALIRQGRVDVKVEFTDTDRIQASSIFNKYFDDKEAEKQFINWAVGRSMSETHGKLIEYKDDLQGLINETKKRANNNSKNSEVARRGHTDSRNKKTVRSTTDRRRKTA